MNYTDTSIGGRPARVANLGRVRAKKGWGYYNLVSVRFLDNNEHHTMGAAEFARWSTKLDRQARQPIGSEPCI